MAIDNHASEIQHSLYGRLFGLDNRKLGIFGGGGDKRYGTETLATTAASTMAAAATTLLTATAPGVYELIPPAASMVGVRKRVINASSTAQFFKLVTGNFQSMYGSSQNTVTVSTRAVIDLEYITTALVAVVMHTSGSTAVFSLSTTT